MCVPENVEGWRGTGWGARRKGGSPQTFQDPMVSDGVARSNTGIPIGAERVGPPCNPVSPMIRSGTCWRPIVRLGGPVLACPVQAGDDLVLIN